LQRPFKRGALGFDDYSYTMHNEYVLVGNQQCESIQLVKKDYTVSEKKLNMIDN